MKLDLKCRNCREVISLKAKSLSRPDLEDEIGEYFDQKCTHCNRTMEYHVNDVHAENSYNGSLLLNVAAIALIVLSTTILWNMGILSNIGLILGGGMLLANNYASFNSNANAFNKYKTRRSKK